MSAKNQELVQKFLASKAFDFAAFGKFIAENGASIAGSGDSEFAFSVSHHFIKYCIPPYIAQLADAVDPAELSSEVLGD